MELFRLEERSSYQERELVSAAVSAAVFKERRLFTNPTKDQLGKILALYHHAWEDALTGKDYTLHEMVKPYSVKGAFRRSYGSELSSTITVNVIEAR